MNNQNKKHKVKSWIKNHKKEIISGCGIVLVVACGVVVYKKKTRLLDTIPCPIVPVDGNHVGRTAKMLSDKVVQPVKVKLTGEFLTATDIGKEMGYISAQKVNKRLVSNGLMEKLPCGDYKLTERGGIWGEVKCKLINNKWIDNIEWDKSVITEIFTKEEIDAEAIRKLKIKEFLETEVL